MLASATAVALAGCTSDDPAPDIGQTAAPGADFAADMVKCLTDRGWTVEATEDGGVTTTVGIPTEQSGQYEADLDECKARFGYDQPPTVTRAEAARIYRGLLEVAECVRDLGYSVPDPPSEQAFVATLMDRPIPQWHPYDAIPHENVDERREVADACPAPRQ